MGHRAECRDNASLLPSVLLVLVLTQFDQRFALTWNVPCAPAPDVSSLPDGEAVVTIKPAGAQWQLQVAFVTPASGVRQLDAPTCEDAARAAVLFLKLGATAQPDRTPVAVRPPEPEPEPAAPPVARTPLVIDVRLDVAAIVNAGALPAVTPRIAATLGVGSGPIAGFLSVRAGVPSTFAGGPGSAGFWVHPALGAELSGCFLARWGRARVGPCAAVVVEWWRVAGLKVDLPLSGSEVWVAAGADGRLQVSLTGRVFVFALAGIRFSLRRPQLIFEGFGDAFVVPLVSGEGALGLGWQW